MWHRSTVGDISKIQQTLLVIAAMMLDPCHYFFILFIHIFFSLSFFACLVNSNPIAIYKLSLAESREQLLLHQFCPSIDTAFTLNQWKGWGGGNYICAVILAYTISFQCVRVGVKMSVCVWVCVHTTYLADAVPENILPEHAAQTNWQQK